VPGIPTTLVLSNKTGGKEKYQIIEKKDNLIIY
jgi:hypothetical protein